MSQYVALCCIMSLSSAAQNRMSTTRDVFLHWHGSALNVQAVVLQSLPGESATAKMSCFMVDLKWQFLHSGSLVWSAVLRKVPVGSTIGIGWLVESNWRPDCRAPQTPPLLSTQFQQLTPLPAGCRSVPNVVLGSLRFASLYKVPAPSGTDAFLNHELHAFMNDAAYRSHLKTVALDSAAPVADVATSQASSSTDAASDSISAVSTGDAYWTGSADVRTHLINLLCGAAYFGDTELIQRLVLEEKVDMQACGKVTSLRNVDDVRGIFWVGKENTDKEFDCSNVFDLYSKSNITAPPLFYAALRGRVDACELLIQLGAQCNYRVSLLFPDHPSCTAAKGTDSTAGSVVAAAALNQDEQASAFGAKPFSALDIATWNAERSVCELLTESMQEADRVSALQHGMAPGLGLGKETGDSPTAAKESEVNRYAQQRTSCPTM